jgi:hypothetical protein
MTTTKTTTKETDHPASRQVVSEDLTVIDQAIADHEALQKNLYLLRRLLGEVGKLDARSADLKRGVEGEQSFLDDLRKQTDAAHQALAQLQKDIQSKRGELREVEQLIQERTVAANQLNEAIARMRNLLEAA